MLSTTTGTQRAIAVVTLDWRQTLLPQGLIRHCPLGQYGIALWGNTTLPLGNTRGGARSRVRSSDATSENVAPVALRFGFRERGRFAVDYREVFGESDDSSSISRFYRRY